MTKPPTYSTEHGITDRAAIVLYDGQCPFCQKSVAILKKLDWLKKLQYQDARQVDQLPRTEPPLDPEELLKEMHLVPRAGQSIYRGFKAFRWMAWRLPLCWPIAPLLYIPGVPWLGNKVYLWVARNRYKLTPCKDGVCELPQRPASARQ
jgi:predicted DCC family thiol-disulfide oxidoreductase YuxK